MGRAGHKTHPWPAAHWCGGWGPCPDESVILLPQSRMPQQPCRLQGPHGGCVEAAEGSGRGLGAREDPVGTDPPPSYCRARPRLAGQGGVEGLRQGIAPARHRGLGFNSCSLGLFLECIALP